MSPTEPKIKVFISYAHADHELHKKLEEHLSSLKYAKEIIVWQDQEIPPGANWENHIDTHLHQADLILLLVSASFIASKYCWNKEVRTALQQHKAGKAQVIPLILKPVDWQNTPIGHLQALPRGAKPITQWNDQDAAFEDVARGMRSAVKQIRRTSLLRKEAPYLDLATPTETLPDFSQSPATTPLPHHYPSNTSSGVQKRFTAGKKIRSQRLALLALIGLMITGLATNLIWPIHLPDPSPGNTVHPTPIRSIVHPTPTGTVTQQSISPGTITEFPVPTPASYLVGIATSPDGNLWFTENKGNKIGRISLSGTITEFPVPPSSDPFGITAGPDSNLWFTERSNNKIGRISISGVITAFPVPTLASSLIGITTGPDGNLWFTENKGNKIGRISPSGTITEFPVPTSTSSLVGITTGPDGNLWFTENKGNKIGRISPSGTITEFPVPPSSDPFGITVGPDGNLWFTEGSNNKIGRISTSGVITEFPIPTSTSYPYEITAGPDGNLWFTEWSSSKIGRISTSGIITEFPISTSYPLGITAGPDGNLWFTENTGNKIGCITSSKEQSAGIPGPLLAL